MNITQASARIAAALQAGQISPEAAARAQYAIRQRVYYGNRMTPRDRASIIRNRFGIN